MGKTVEKIMNKSELATKMIEWETKKKEIDLLEAEIKRAVMLLEESFTVGDINAGFRAGTRSFDYEAAGKKASETIILLNTSQKTTTNWKKVCKDADIKDIPFTTGNPSITLKIKKSKKTTTKDVLVNEEPLPF